MSLVGMRSALGEALSHAASRKQVDAVIALVQMVESDFESTMVGDKASARQRPLGSGVIAGSTHNVGV